MPGRREVMLDLAENLAELQRLLDERDKKIRDLEKEKSNLDRQLNDSQREHQEDIDELGGRIEELSEKIRDLTGGESPIAIGTFIVTTEPGRARMLDNHQIQYEVNVVPSIKDEDLEEGKEVKYIVNPKTGSITIFEVSKIRRSEEGAVVEEIIDGGIAWVILHGDAHKLVNIGRKVAGLEKGDEVYYDSRVNFITGIIPKKKEKVDLNRIEKKTYRDIGGLGEQIRKVREMVELPLKHPELYGHLGVKPLKGILLTGPPGCGKTLIGKAVANESEAYFIYVGGPDFISSYVGESAAKLRNIFEQARRNAPTIIFFDELDAVAGERDETEHTHDKQVVAQLLSLMDGLISSEKVMVIAATNKPELLDEAFRRPGRFDREIVIPVPDRNSRLDILKIYANPMPLADDVSLEALADETHGFTGADIESLCKEAALRVMEGVDPENISKDDIKKIRVGQGSFKLALERMKPSIMRQVAFQKPQESWADVGGLDQIKQKLEEAIKWPLLYPELLQVAGQKSPKGNLLFGPPGCGKTLIARAFAHECGVNFIPVKGPELLHELVGRSERNVREVFRKARQAAPCIIFFDEIDALASGRGSRSNDSGVGNRVTSQLLNELDGIEEAKGIFVLAATNRPDLVDTALLRPGRLVPLYIPLPDEQAREKIFAIHTKGKPLAEDVDLKFLAKQAKLSAGESVPCMIDGQWIDLPLPRDMPFSGAHIENICREATQKALREFIAVHDPKKDYKDLKIYMKHFEQAFEEILSSVKASAKDTEALAQKDDERPPEGKGAPKKARKITDKDLKRVT